MDSADLLSARARGAVVVAVVVVVGGAVGLTNPELGIMPNPESSALPIIQNLW